MDHGFKAPIVREIERQSEDVRRLALADALELERLRDETATLQAMIAEATRLRLREGRQVARGTALLFPVVVESDEFIGYGQVGNLSADGMTARVPAQFSRPQRVCVHFTSQVRAEGTLVRADDERVGIEFAQPFDVPAMLASVSSPGSPRSDRMARLPIRCLAEITSGDLYQFAEASDVSQHGLKVSSRMCRPGQEVTVQLQDLEQRTATVRWSRSGLAGLSFARPLSFDELAQFGRWDG